MRNITKWLKWRHRFMLVICHVPLPVINTYFRYGQSDDVPADTTGFRSFRKGITFEKFDKFLNILKLRI